MSKHHNRGLPPPNRVPQNIAGMAFLEVQALHVSSWSSLPDGKGPSTQVHLRLDVPGLSAPLIVRFKGPDTLDLLIQALERHRNDVWPGG